MGCHPDEARRRALARANFATFVGLVLAKETGSPAHMGHTTSGSELIGVDFEGVRYNLTITRDRNQ